MDLIKSLMGRRQFLIAAGVTSTSALALNRLAGVVDPVFNAGVATASERSGSSGTKETGLRYSNLLSPIKIGNVVLKNRMYYTKANPTGLQGPETFPNEALKFYGLAEQFFIIGDCDEAGFLPAVSRTAYAAASQI